MMRRAVLFPVLLTATAALALTMGGAAAEERALSPWPPPRPGALVLIPDYMVSSVLDGELEIAGSAIGGGAQPSSFYLWAREALDSPAATEAQFLELTRHTHQAIRTVGMAGLAERGGPAAVARLREMLTSRESSCGHPVGCVDAWIYEAYTAWQFLTGTDYLCLKRGEPLLNAAQRLALAVELLHRDDTPGVRGVPWSGIYGTPRDCLTDEFLTGRLPMTLEALRGAAPAVPDYLLVKAMGRVHPRLVTGFLISMAHTRDAGPLVRLAAASVLLHIPQGAPADPDFHNFFDGLREELNGFHAARFGDRFLGFRGTDWSYDFHDWNRFEKRGEFTPEKKSAYERLFSGITMNRTLGRGDPDKNVDGSPTALALALSSGVDNWLEESPWEELAAWLDRHAAIQRLWRDDWNAFGDTLEMLEVLARRDPLESARHGMPESGRKAILEAIEKIRRPPAEPVPVPEPQPGPDGK